jgi:nucleoside-diphosphate-sugar epimerase
MEIVGNGFLARNLRPIAGRHRDVVTVAGGVSSTATVSDAEFLREATQLYDIIRRCRREDRRVVFFSTASAAMYGADNGTGVEDGPVFPHTPYGRHKLAMEAVLANSGADYLVLRLSHVVGPDQPSHQLLPALVRQVMAGQVRLYRDARRDLVDVVDVRAALDGLLRAGVSRQVVNIAAGVAAPVADIVRHIERIVGRTAEHEVVEVAGNHSAGPISIARLRSLVADCPGTGDYRAILDRYVRAAAGAVS